jgi:hypothetical protein
MLIVRSDGLRLVLAVLIASSVTACQPEETPGGVILSSKTPTLVLRLCGDESITAARVLRAQNEEVVWSARLAEGAEGKAQVAWGSQPQYETDGLAFTSAPGGDLYFEAEGHEGRSLGRWSFTQELLKEDQILLGYPEPRYMSPAELSRQQPVGC